jgi:hypothetical protein
MNTENATNPRQRLTKEEIERFSVSEVLRIQESDLEGPWRDSEGRARFPYMYDGAPEWLQRDLEGEFPGAQFATGITSGGGFQDAPPEEISEKNGRWVLVRSYAHGAETECPLTSAEMDFYEDRTDPTVRPSDCIGPNSDRCPYCENTVGEPHGYIYIGEGYEAVYRLEIHETDSGRVPAEFRILNHGPDHSQYFNGHGIAFSNFEDCATGIGDNAKEALSDALDQLASNGWDVETIENSDEARALCGRPSVEDWHDCAAEIREAEEREDFRQAERIAEACEHHWFVSVDVRGFEKKGEG